MGGLKCVLLISQCVCVGSFVDADVFVFVSMCRVECVCVCPSVLRSVSACVFLCTYACGCVCTRAAVRVRVCVRDILRE